MSPRAETRRGSRPWIGNTTATTDDASGFYDRSLGAITNGSLATQPYQLTAAQITTGTRSGALATAYDAAGNLTTLVVDRNGPCTPTGKCSHVYAYEWDELNRLSRAHRWDFADIPDVTAPPTVTVGTEDADLRYAYDNDDNRVIKDAHDTAAGTDAHTLYIFSSLEERHTSYNAGGSGDYDIGPETEVPYLFANGVRLARVVYNPSAPVSDPSDQHVFLELGDHLGSTSTVLDKVTGELVEKASYQPYGATESDYRPGRWGDFREDYRFTGKEEDVEVGLTYFGKRYLNPLLGRWVSPDPLGVHEPGKADLNLYAYVHGRVFNATDPIGLAETATVPGDANVCVMADAAPPQNASYAPPGADPAGENKSVPPSDLMIKQEQLGQLKSYDRPTAHSEGLGDPLNYVAPNLAGMAASILPKIGVKEIVEQATKAGAAEVVEEVGTVAAETVAKGTEAATASGVTRPTVEDAKLNNLVRDLYKGANTKNPIGTGSTADAIRHEAASGQAVGGKFHAQKGEEYAAALQKWLNKNPTASSADRAAAQSILGDLRSALGKK